MSLKILKALKSLEEHCFTLTQHLLIYLPWNASLHLLHPILWGIVGE